MECSVLAKFHQLKNSKKANRMLFMSEQFGLEYFRLLG